MSTMIWKLMLAAVFLSLAVRCTEADCKVGKQTYSVGEEWKEDGKCVQNRCTGIGELNKKGCPLIQASNDYYFTDEDPEKDYPQCCPQAVKINNVQTKS